MPELKLISSNGVAEQEKLHASGDYGTASGQYAPMVSAIIEKMGVTHILDYGCGAQCTLARALTLKQKITYQAYDPGVPRFARLPMPAQMICCIDVLEHIEPDKIEDVLDHITRLCEGIVFLTVTTIPAMKTLEDGRNAHLIQEPMQWWLPKFWDRFDLQTVQVLQEGSFCVIGTAKARMASIDGTNLV